MENEFPKITVKGNKESTVYENGKWIERTTLKKGNKITVGYKKPNTGEKIIQSTTTYDSKGRVIKILTNTNLTTYLYGLNGNYSVVYKGLGEYSYENKIEYIFNEHNKLSVEIQTNSKNHLKNRIRNSEVITSYYNEFGKVIKETILSETLTQNYDDKTLKLFLNKKKTEDYFFEYDDNNRLISKIFPENIGRIEYIYCDDRLVEMKKYNGKNELIDNLDKKKYFY